MVDEGCSFCVAVQHHGSQFWLPGALLAPGSASQILTKGSTCCVAVRHRPRPSLSLTSACAPHPAPATGGDSVGQHFCISIYNKTNVLTIAFRLCLTFRHTHMLFIYHVVTLVQVPRRMRMHKHIYIYTCMYARGYPCITCTDDVGQKLLGASLIAQDRDVDAQCRAQSTVR